MDKKSKEELAEFFGEAFREVVLPEFEGVNGRLDKIEKTVSRIEDRLVKHDNHLDRHDAKLDNHEKRISQIEAAI